MPKRDEGKAGGRETVSRNLRQFRSGDLEQMEVGWVAQWRKTGACGNEH